MDNGLIEIMEQGKSKTVTERTEEKDGSSVETRVEEVEGGFIKTVIKRYKDGDDWEYDTKKSVSIANPLDKKTLAEKLESTMK
tara:strand:- start:448 stop:696 length:249 start_codon:yes stop_codon:yes gene_type:complete